VRRGALLAACACAATWLAAALAGPKPPPRQPPSYVPSPIAIARIRFDVRGGRAMVTTDLTLPAGQTVREDLDVHVAFGGPGIPMAFDAQLLSTPRGYLVAPIEQPGDKLGLSSSTRSPSHAAFTLGRAEMAGELVHIPAALLNAKLADTGQATLRIREVRELPAPLADGTRELLARLGSCKGKPMVLGLLELASDEPIARTDARLCGLQASGARLFVSAPASSRAGVAPPLAQRSAAEDLCLRFGPAPSPTQP
jgi:hypothetical protein